MATTPANGGTGKCGVAWQHLEGGCGQQHLTPRREHRPEGPLQRIIGPGGDQEPIGGYANSLRQSRRQLSGVGIPGSATCQLVCDDREIGGRVGRGAGAAREVEVDRRRVTNWGVRGHGRDRRRHAQARGNAT